MVQAYAQQLLNQKDDSHGNLPPESPPENPMVAATHRLRAALTRLERNIVRQLDASPPSNEAQQELLLFSRENEALRHERDQLNSAIEQLQSQYGELHHVATAIYGKLDASIKKLSHILES